MLDKLDLSIIVCSRNGARTIAIALESLATQTLGPERYEVIVVDDGSTDKTSERAASLGARVVRLDPNGGLAAARNEGVSAARGEIIAFTDDDCEASPDWATEILEAFADPRVDGVSGQVIPDAANGFVRRFLRANNPLVPQKAELLASASPLYRLRLYARRTLLGDGELPSELYSVVGANMAFRRRLIHELDGFDEAFRFGAEEEDLCRRAHMRQSGALFVYAHSARVVHRFRDEIWDILRRSRAYGRGNARRVLKHPDSRLIAFPSPLLTLAMLAAATIARSRRLGGVAAALPLLLYPRWAAQFARERSAAPLTYPYLQMAQEIAVMMGEIDGLRAGYQAVPSRHLKAPAGAFSASDAAEPAVERTCKD